MLRRARRAADALRRLIATVAVAWVGHVVAAEVPPVTVLQGGEAVLPVDGVVTLRREPFLILATPGLGPASLVAERAGTVPATDPAGVRLVAAPASMAMATTPLSLQTQAVPPETFDGLSAALLEQWGTVLGPDRIAAYRDLEESRFGKLPVLMAGRQHPAGRAGSQPVWAVFALDGDPVDRTPIASIVLHVFRAVVVSGTDAAWSVLLRDSVLLRFRGDAAKPAAPSTPDSPGLDCGRSAVITAVRSAQWQRVERLLRDGLDPNLRSTKRGVTLLMCALSGPRVYPETVAALLAGGSDPNRPAADGQTSLHWAVRAVAQPGFATEPLEALDLLTRRGGDIEAESESGETPLLLAVAQGSAEAVTMLMLAGADPAIQNRRGESALARAARLGRKDLVRWMEALRGKGD